MMEYGRMQAYTAATAARAYSGYQALISAPGYEASADSKYLLNLSGLFQETMIFCCECSKPDSKMHNFYRQTVCITV